jgi:3'-phosphoadenosine 5'-phosphosulfate sulfotransferase (PAPS reductase)/FAD synthetase
MKILIFYSGGKDSQASLIWAVNKYGVDNCEAVFCDTGWENPITYEHIKTTCNQIGVKLVTIKSDKYNGMEDLAVKKKRFPSTMARFCTEELKSKPAIDYVLTHNENLIIIEGIRASESFSRSKMNAECTYFKYYFEPYKIDKNGKKKYHTYRKKEIKEWCKIYNADKIRPIFTWQPAQVIDYIKDNGQLPNPLYYQGFQRVGCFPCVMARHQEVRLISDNHPEMWKRLENAEVRIGRSFFPPNYIPNHACKNNQYPMIADVKKYFENKNATLDMFDGEQPGCMSAYNLCE